MNIEDTIKVLSHEMACVRRQTGSGCDRNCAACDLVLPDEQVLSAYWTAINILRAKLKAVKNGPLTPEELRGMDGRPVWCVTRSGFTFWALVNASRKGDFYTINSDGGTLRESGYGIGPGERSKYSIGWIAYERPPEGELTP